MQGLSSSDISILTGIMVSEGLAIDTHYCLGKGVKQNVHEVI